MVEGMQGQGQGRVRVDRGQQHVRPDQRATKEAKDLSLTNSKYQAAIESIVALQNQMTAQASKVQQLTESLKSAATPARRQAIARELATASEQLRRLKEQLARARAGVERAVEAKTGQLQGRDSRPDVALKLSGAVLLGTIGVLAWRRLKALSRRF